MLSATLAGVTYLTARQYIVHQRETSVVHQAFVNASLVRSSLRGPHPNIPQILLNLDNGPGVQSIVQLHGQTFSPQITGRSDAVDPSVRRVVATGHAATQVSSPRGAPEITVGVPIPAVGAAYYEITSLKDVSATLRILLLTLAIGALAITLLGALVGRLASARALRPLGDVTTAASAIARGKLDTRLVTSDTADLADLVSAFNSMADRLQERIESETRFSSDVSHELRSPLQTLATAVSLLEARSNELTPRAKQAVFLLSAEVRRFQRVVSDLLEISRFDTRSAELALDDVLVDELVRRATSPYHLDVEVHRSASDMRVRVDKRRIERVIANLVENAQIYAGGVSHISVEGLDGVMRLVVDDAGPGIPAEEREAVFERFYRGPAARRRGVTEGTGLGLSLVKEHVALHGGRTWAEEAPGGGARFIVELPVERT